MKPILTRETHDHTLALLHRIIPFPPFTTAELALEVAPVCVGLVSRSGRGEGAFC